MKNVLSLENFQLISEDEAIERFELDAVINGFSDMDVLLYDGDLVVNQDFTLETTIPEDVKGRFSGYIITGDLVVDGYIFNYENDYGPFMYVMGNVKAKNINMGGSELYIEGNVDVENVIYGEYNHGIIAMCGNVKAKAIFSSDHSIELYGKIDALILSDRGSISGDIDFEDEELEDILLPELFCSEGDVDSRALCNYILENKNIIKSGKIKTKKEKALDRVNELVQCKVKSIDLSYQKLTEFPEILTTHTTLEELILDGNSIPTLPNSIKNLKNLTKLSLAQNYYINNFPDAILELESLEELNLDSTNIKSIPKEIIKLKNLKYLNISNLGEDNIISDDIFDVESLDNLETLIITGSSYKFMNRVPQSIFKLKNLKNLNLSGNFIENISEEIFNLENLEILNLNGVLSKVKIVPDLSKLKNLKKLYFDGHSGHTGMKNPDVSVLNQLLQLKMPQLELLDINRWKGLNELPESFSENFCNLKKLDLSFCDIINLPESFYNLKNLKELSLYYNSKLSSKCAEKLMESFPKTRIDLRDTGFKKTIDNPKIAKFRDKTKKIAKELSKANIDVDSKFKELIEYGEKTGFYSDYDYLYAHYKRVYCYTHGIVLHERDEAIQIDKMLEFEEIAKKTLTLLPTDGIIWHFTDEGAFQEEIFREIYGGLSWYKYQQYLKNGDKNLLDEAFQYVENGSKYVQQLSHYYILDTKVRILLELGKKDEAYRIVARVLKNYSDFEDFEDIKESEDYQNWYQKNI